MASAWATNWRLTAINPIRFSSLAGMSVSKLRSREVSAAIRVPLSANQTKGGIGGAAHGVVKMLVAVQARADRQAQQIRQQELPVGPFS